MPERKKIRPRKMEFSGLWWILSAVSLVVVIVGVWAVAADRIGPEKVAPLSATEATKVIQYTGQNDKTVLELLKTNNDVKEEKSDLGVFVSEINGVKNSDKEFWIYYVNEEIGLTSADKYVTKDGDKVEWRYESLK